MVEMKKWVPFRFARQARRNPEAPARKSGTGPLALVSMQDEMERMFERLWSNPFAVLETQDRWFGDFAQEQFLPKLDVTDNATHLKVALEIPGLDAKDVDIEVQDGLLTVKGEKKQEESKSDEGCYRTERAYGFFQRTVPLPADVDQTKAEARFEKGVLTIQLPKAERAKKQSVHVAVKS
jgi:HSP20 family protein